MLDWEVEARPPDTETADLVSIAFRLNARLGDLAYDLLMAAARSESQLPFG